MTYYYAFTSGLYSDYGLDNLFCREYPLTNDEAAVICDEIKRAEKEYKERGTRECGMSPDTVVWLKWRNNNPAPDYRSATVLVHGFRPVPYTEVYYDYDVLEIRERT